LARFGPLAPGDAETLHRRIRAARERGYALVDEEFEPGLVGGAAPVRDFSGRIIAAVNVSGPKFRLGKRLRTAGVAVRVAAGALADGMVTAPGGAGNGAPQVTRSQNLGSRTTI
jgi:IclR family KDG regulon transcriptional repressor